jgi:hypothetical protein
MSNVIFSSKRGLIPALAVAAQLLTPSAGAAAHHELLRPDLVASTISARLSTNAVMPGETLVVEWSGYNNGTVWVNVSRIERFGGARGPWLDAVFLVCGSSTYFLGTARFKGRLAPGEEYQGRGTFQVPEDVPPGDYQLEVRLDYLFRRARGRLLEQDESNNSARAALHVLPIRPFLPDLFTTQRSFEISTNQLVPGEWLSVRWEGLNNATACLRALGTPCVERFGPASGTWEDSVFIVNDSTRRKLGSVQFTGSIEPGGEYELEGTFRIPLDLLPGEYNLELKLDDAPDPAGNLREANESNNVLAVPRALRVVLDPPRPF